MKLVYTGCLGLLLTAAVWFASAQSQMPTGTDVRGAQTAGGDLSASSAEVVKLAQSGVSDEVVLAFVENSPGAFSLSADDIVYLRDVGISSEVITGMLNHDKTIPRQTSQYTYDQRLYPSTGVAQTSQPVAAQATPVPEYVSDAPADVSYFYNDLSPYGTWVNLDGYGWCWQPSVVVINRGWQPYSDGGRWIYSDAGWYWHSDYSWGWAPFHYGRWHHHPRNGWVWFPDRVWGPAWVTWRVSGDYCGWAPLPLHATFGFNDGFRFNGVSVGVNFDFGLRADFFTFVRFGDFCERDVWRRRVPRDRVTQVFNNTTVINNITVVNNRTVVNRGAPIERIRAESRADLRPVPVRDVPAGSRGGLSAGERSGPTRRELGPPARGNAVVAQRVNDRNPVIRHEGPRSSANRGRGSADISRVDRGSGAPGATGNRGQTQISPRTETPRTQTQAPSRGASDSRGRGGSDISEPRQPMAPAGSGNRSGVTRGGEQQQQRIESPASRGRGQNDREFEQRQPTPTQVTPRSQPQQPERIESPASRGRGQNAPQIEQRQATPAPVTPRVQPQQPQRIESSPSRGRGQNAPQIEQRQATPAPVTPRVQPQAPVQSRPNIDNSRQRGNSFGSSGSVAPRQESPVRAYTPPSARSGNPHQYVPRQSPQQQSPSMSRQQSAPVQRSAPPQAQAPSRSSGNSFNVQSPRDNSRGRGRDK